MLFQQMGKLLIKLSMALLLTLGSLAGLYENDMFVYWLLG